MLDIGSPQQRRDSSRNIFGGAISLGKLASWNSRSNLISPTEGGANKSANSGAQGRLRSGSRELRDLRVGSTARMAGQQKKSALRGALASSPAGRRMMMQGQGTSWLEKKIVQRTASRTQSLARMMSQTGSFMRGESMSSSFLDPTKNYSNHVRKAAAHREMSLSTLEFSKLWEKAAESDWDEAMGDEDEVFEVDVDEDKEARRGTSFTRFQHTATTLDANGNAISAKQGVRTDDQIFESPTTLHRKSHFLRRFLNPLSRTRKIWDVVLMFMLVFDCLIMPVMAFMEAPRFSHYWMPDADTGPGLMSRNMEWLSVWTFVLFFSYLVDVMYLLDFISMFYTVRMRNGRAIVFPQAIRWAFLNSPDFPIDLLGVIPFELFGIMAGRPDLMLVLRAPRMVRSHRVAIKINNARMNIRSNTVGVMLAVIIFYVFMGSHWLACFWYGVGIFNVGSGEETWVEHYTLAYENFGTTWQRRYAVSLYWTVATLTSVGYGDITAQSTEEHIFALTVMVCGHALYAYIFGLMATLISNQDFAAAQFRAKLAGIRQFMAYRLLPDDLCERIDTYYDHLWAETKGFNEMRIIRELPSSVAQDLSLHMYESFITKVPLFKAAEAGFIRALVSRLQPEIYPGFEFVVRKGDVGKHMFFIQRGVCEVIEETTDVVLFLLEEGGYFGEIALLMAERRTASVRTGTVCDMLILSRKDLEDVLESYPKMRRELVEEGKKRIRDRKKKEHEVSQIIIKRWQDAQTKKKIADELRDAGKNGVGDKAKKVVGWWKSKLRGSKDDEAAAATVAEEARTRRDSLGSGRRGSLGSGRRGSIGRRGSADGSFKLNGNAMADMNERQLREYLQQRKDEEASLGYDAMSLSTAADDYAMRMQQHVQGADPPASNTPRMLMAQQQQIEAQQMSARGADEYDCGVGGYTELGCIAEGEDEEAEELPSSPQTPRSPLRSHGSFASANSGPSVASAAEVPTMVGSAPSARSSSEQDDDDDDDESSSNASPAPCTQHLTRYEYCYDPLVLRSQPSPAFRLDLSSTAAAAAAVRTEPY